MKKNIHPTIHRNAKVTDLSSGKSFTIASTKEEMTLEVTNLTHPFYTGKHRIVDTENLVKKFEKKRSSANAKKVEDKKKKNLRRRQKISSISSEGKMTLKDMLNNVK